MRAENPGRWQKRKMILLLLFLLSLLPMGAMADQILQYRIRPVMESLDAPRLDGAAYIGNSGGQARTAQILLSPKARTSSGQETDLFQLLREHRGSVVSAYWRLEARECMEKEGQFLLWPKGDQKATLKRRAREGWNLWEVTSLIRGIVREGKTLSLRLQSAESDGNRGGVFDLANSWICVNIAWEEAAGESSDMITDHDLLDMAFAALPENHWTVKRYREIAEAIVIPQWPETGVPYYFGGHKEEKVLRPYVPSQPSKYYRTSRYYLGGFDCSSYIRWIEENTGYAQLDALDEIIRDRAAAFPLSRNDPSGWMQALLPGDLILIDHGTFHVGMIIGTPRMYGLDESSVPELAGWLDYPMMIHCGEDPFCYDRFRAYIKTLTYRIPITPPDGGVTVSLIVSSIQDAPRIRQAPWKKNYGYFQIGDQQMTVYPLSDCRRLAWMRPVQNREE